MARIPPLEYQDAPPDARAAHDAHQRDVGRITNMKRTLLRSMPAFEALMAWYPLRDTVRPFLGERLTHLFAHAVSTESDCLYRSALMARFSGKVALITGAPHGQGRAVVVALAREGARIAAPDVARPLAYPGYTLGSSRSGSRRRKARPGELSAGIDRQRLRFASEQRRAIALPVVPLHPVRRDQWQEPLPLSVKFWPATGTNCHP